jgi:hypothetical protein
MTSASNLRDQKERREIVAAERRLRQGDQPPSTFFQQAQIGRRLEPGDHPEAQRDLQITGEGVYQVPRLPASSPWAGDPVGQEPPLGVDLSIVERCGTAQEIERAADILAARELAASSFANPASQPSQMIDDCGAGRHPPPPALPAGAETASPVALAEVSPLTAIETGDAVISPEDEQRLKALLGQGLRRRKI